MKRVFIAIDVPDKLKAKVDSYIKFLISRSSDLRISWEKAEKLHLTLKFLGNTDEKLLSVLEQKIGEVAESIESFNLKVSGNGIFPNVRNPRVLWLGIEEESGKLFELQNLVEKSCLELGFEADKREFKPHLTIARIRDSQKALELAKLHLRSSFEEESFVVSEVTIYESLLLPNGSVYKVLSRHGLKTNFL